MRTHSRSRASRLRAAGTEGAARRLRLSRERAAAAAAAAAASPATTSGGKRRDPLASVRRPQPDPESGRLGSSRWAPRLLAHDASVCLGLGRPSVTRQALAVLQGQPPGRSCAGARVQFLSPSIPHRDKELPGSSPHEAKKLRQETRCANKWIKMLKRWDHYLPSEKLRLWVYKVVPPQVRGQVWLQLLNVQVKARNAGKYQEMKEAALVSRGIMQIDLDINRTFRSHTMFWDRYRVGRWATARA
ncbi:uncharacterized protein [Vulpes vulpes]|uniref:Rab-GAP TBC domain-containing protein n=1 Tax=Vulpes vulpes TaxID=9627 RepID=A0ABM5AF22_VULVU